MLPGCIGKRVEAVFDPVVSGFFSTGRAEPGFTRMRDFKRFVTIRTNKAVITEEICTADNEFQDIDNNTEPDKVGVFKKKFPPIPIVEKNISKFNTFIIDIFLIDFFGLLLNYL